MGWPLSCTANVLIRFKGINNITIDIKVEPLNKNLPSLLIDNRQDFPRYIHSTSEVPEHFKTRHANLNSPQVKRTILLSRNSDQSPTR